MPDRSGVLTRREFMAVSGGAVGVLATFGVAGCSPTQGQANADVPLLTDRPLLTEWADGILRMEAPARELPVAYVSMSHRQVFVDQEFRDRASWLLRAHISVSTWHWRIPLPGDGEGVPIAPGDEAREFEELSIREWDPAMAPAMDDIRIRRGRSVIRRVALDCVELAGVRTVDLEASQSGVDARPLEAWLRGVPLDVVVSDESTGDTMREDFHLLGTALRFQGRTCTGTGEVVQIAGWAARPDDDGSPAAQRSMERSPG